MRILEGGPVEYIIKLISFTNKYIPKEFLQIRVIWSVFESQGATIVEI